MTQGTLYGVSVGPGNPELLTLRAIRAIREADVIAVPDAGKQRRIAYSIAEEYLEGKEILECPTPMTTDRAAIQAAHTRIADGLCALLDAGKDVAYLCLGDVGVYSTYGYIHDIVRERGYASRAIPGVTSFCAAAAKLGVALCKGSERLVVAPLNAGGLDVVLSLPGNKVFMKPGHGIDDLKERLADRGLLDRASMVADCGLPGERVFERLEDAGDEGYLSVIVVSEGQ